MRARRLLVILFLPIVAGATPTRPETGTMRRLVHTLKGRDGNGVVVDRRLTVLKSGAAQYIAESGDEACSPRTGLYTGRVDATTLATLSAQASRVAGIPNTKPSPGTIYQRRTVNSAMEVLWQTTADVRVRPEAAGPEWQELESTIGRIRKSLTPSRVLQMTVLPGKRKNKVDIEFRLIGPGPVAVMFPRNAEEAFQIAAHPEWQLMYIRRPENMHPTLTAASPVVKIRLKVKNPRPTPKTPAQKAAKKGRDKSKAIKPEIKGEIVYRNDGIRHHSPVRGERPVVLCAKR